MKTLFHSIRSAGLLWCVLLAETPVMAGVPQPDFRLEDVNPNSPRYTRMISPRDYRQQVSAYYFGWEA